MSTAIFSLNSLCPSAPKMTEDIKNIWRNADAVCFDVDSTVIQNEAIDELAAFCGKADQVKAM